MQTSTSTSTRAGGAGNVRNLQRLPLTGGPEEETAHAAMAAPCSVFCVHLGYPTAGVAADQ